MKMKVKKCQGKIETHPRTEQQQESETCVVSQCTYSVAETSMDGTASLQVNSEWQEGECVCMCHQL